MKDASQYPVTFPYGSTAPPYSLGHAHRGDDRPTPTGTPVIIGGVTIGLTGATGNVTGQHLHLQEWAGDYATTRKPQNAFQSGTVTNIDPNGTQGDGSFGKFITIQTSDGWNDSYCHLSVINVTKGQIIGESMTDKNQIGAFTWAFFGRDARPTEVETYGALPLQETINRILTSPEYLAFYNYRNANLGVSTDNPSVIVNGTNYVPEGK